MFEQGIIKQVREKTEYDTIKREPPNILLEKRDPKDFVAGYREGPKNPYVEKLMQL